MENILIKYWQFFEKWIHLVSVASSTHSKKNLQSGKLVTKPNSYLPTQKTLPIRPITLWVDN